jgi:6-pyruvoyltetrahydropterin/6-carboxytetrahydropterin synthase
MTDRLSTIELFKENMSFSAGHFAIFSKEKRENLHGHHYRVYVAYQTVIDDKGLAFDNRFYKVKLHELCKSLDQSMLAPAYSPYLRIEDAGEYYHLYFHTEKLFFLKRDLKILPVTNVTVEELSHYILSQLLLDQDELDQHRIQAIKVKVFSGPGQSASAKWKRMSVMAHHRTATALCET